MKTLVRVLWESAIGLAVLVASIFAGSFLYRLIADLFPSAGMDRSQDAATGAGVLLGLLVLVAHVVRRVLRRRKRLRAEPT